MRWKRYLIVLLALVCLTGLLNPSGRASHHDRAAPTWPGRHHLPEELTPKEIRQDKYFRLEDEKGRVILETGRRVREGDSFLDGDNRLYKVFEVSDRVGIVRYVETVKIDVDLPRFLKLKGKQQPAASLHESGDTARASGGRAAPEDKDGDGEDGDGEPEQPDNGEKDEGKDKREGGNDTEEQASFLIALYHTHNDECYVPTDGVEHRYGPGGVHAVGRAMKVALEAKGIDVIYSDDLHLPHDRGAYRRSRPTAWKLARRAPDAIFDIHRDAAPAEIYEHEIAGRPVARIMIVVGRANPNLAVNREFAYDLKGYADKVYPGLLRGVYIAEGSYNQDLFPLNLLLECGSHKNPRGDAERGVTYFADVVSYYFYGPEFIDIEERNGKQARERAVEEREAEDSIPPAQRKEAAGSISSAVSGTVIGLMLAALLVLLGFFFINNPAEGRGVKLWLKHLPATVRTFHRRSADRLRNLPAIFRSMREEFPHNLRSDFRRLAEEAGEMPGNISGFAGDTRERFRAGIVAIPEKIEELRFNCSETFSLLREEAGDTLEQLRQIFVHTDDDDE
ncbi:MAG: hypothetical protein GX887_05895 [Firmicutes bacterium]|nr:hypothetical protein [Bacillota bacterium]